ncbi:MAG: response regulator receiver protein, partial [Clostridia bacterium]|nr:response regulator receiver protein [Clostridia bacterium]
MPNENDLQSVLIVSKTDKPIEFIKEVLPKNDFYPILSAANAGEAKRALINSDVDIVIINTPLGDDFGMRLAIDIVTERKAGVLLLVKTELYEEVSY